MFAAQMKGTAAACRHMQSAPIGAKQFSALYYHLRPESTCWWLGSCRVTASAVSASWGQNASPGFPLRVCCLQIFGEGHALEDPFGMDPMQLTPAPAGMQRSISLSGSRGCCSHAHTRSMWSLAIECNIVVAWVGLVNVFQ